MNERKIRCSKCGAMKVVFVAKSADPFDTRPSRYVCEKCGEKHRNKYATDDSMKQILAVMSGSYKY